MAEVTKIQWCDHTFNPWIGCAHAIYTGVDGNQHAHQGCLRCYAEADMDKRRGRVQWGPKGTRSRTSDDYWKQPLKWNRGAAKAGERRRVFCASLADVFEDWQGPIRDANGQVLLRSYLGDAFDTYDDTLSPWEEYSDKQGWQLRTMADLRSDLFKLIDATPNLDWLLLTKRPENVRRMWPRTHGSPKDQTAPDPSRVETGRYWHRSNAWLLASISDQPTADAMIPPLLQCADLVPVLGVSAEPLLGPIDLLRVKWPGVAKPGTGGHEPHRVDVLRAGYWEDRNVFYKGFVNHSDMPGKINFVIIGGESGPHARPMDLAWARSLLDQCHAANVPAFFKQAGSKPESIPDRISYRGSKTPKPNGFYRHLRDPKGGDLSELPAWCNVRQFPEVSHA